MKQSVSRVIQISDLVQWYNNGELDLSPKYQRNSVWNENAKAYLIDTIIRGLPIPPIFMRQRVDVYTRINKREIIDGQQRVRAILEYVEDRFPIKKSHNKDLGGKKYSELDEDIKSDILEFEIVTEIVNTKVDSQIYDMFARLNSNNYVLNKQEIRNAKYWGDFKVFVYSLATELRSFFIEYGILSDKKLTRMEDAELINSLVILVMDGIVYETPKYVDNKYAEYDEKFEQSRDIEACIIETMWVLSQAYKYYEGDLSCLKNKNYFFTFFATVHNQLHGIQGQSIPRNPNFDIDFCIDRTSNFLYEYGKFKVGDHTSSASTEEWRLFEKNHKSRTTNKDERQERIEFMNRFYI